MFFKAGKESTILNSVRLIHRSPATHYKQLSVKLQTFFTYKVHKDSCKKKYYHAERKEKSFA